jgi:RNA polymerase sigma factor for flagellar operon FliA
LIGLLNAVRSYDPEAGSRFESYARVRIRGAILDELRRLDWVPRSVHEKARKVQAAMQAVEQEMGRPAKDEEVAEALEISVADYERLLDEIRPATFVCLDGVAGEEDACETSRHGSVPDESQPDPHDVVARRELAAIMGERIRRLPEIQRKVLALYYFEDLRLREIAEVFGVTESRICQIHTQAILALRAHMTRHETSERAASSTTHRA